MDRSIRLGFVALNDSAPLIIAKERGYFRRHGLNVKLVREPSWANIRDKVQAGLLDGAQMLAPMAVAISLGLESPCTPMTVPLCLSLNGNAVTVSNSLYERMRRADPAALEQRGASARALRAVTLEDRAAARPRLRFGVVFPFSGHYYELMYWAASAGIDPVRDLDIRVVPPASMVEGMRLGQLDGYCVGEPWNQLAADQGVGRAVVSKHDIWNNSPEKVLAFTADWARENHEICLALVRALLEAARWVDRAENRLEAVHVIAGESFVDAPVPVVARALLGHPVLGEQIVEAPDYQVFHRYAAGFPWVSHAIWYASQMLRWGQIEKPVRLRSLAAEVYRTDLYREAAAQIGDALPSVDEKVEGVHAGPWTLHDAREPIAMGPDLFLDGRRFDPAQVVAYLEQSEVTRLRVRLDDLALWNP